MSKLTNMFDDQHQPMSNWLNDLAIKEAKRCLRCDLELELQEKLHEEKPLEVKKR